MSKITISNIKTKKSAVILLIILAAVLVAAVIATSRPGGFGLRETINAGTPEGREKYLNSLGWEIDMDSEVFQEIIIPSEFTGAIAEYAQMQDAQGFDFTSYRGAKCSRYTYNVTNYSSYSDTVYATLYVKGCRVIGGDIHAAEINGFMHGIK